MLLHTAVKLDKRAWWLRGYFVVLRFERLGVRTPLVTGGVLDQKTCTLHSTGSEVIKLISCSTQLSIKFKLLINIK